MYPHTLGWRDSGLPQTQEFSGSEPSVTKKTTPPLTPLENKETSDSFSDAFSRQKDKEVTSKCVWVGNVAPEITEAVFRKQFEQFGEIELIRMFARSKCAFVTFKSADSAKASLKLEGKLLGSMYLTLNLGKASPHLWVGNIGQQVTELDLRTAFEAYGTVESVRVLRGNKCAFVNFSNENEALKALEGMNGQTLGNQKIVINFQWENSFKRPGRLRGPSSGPSSGAPGSPSNGSGSKGGSGGTRYPPGIARSFDIPSRQLFVGSIVPSVTDGTLWHLFSKFGEVEQIKGYANRGYAFIVFRSLQVAIWVREQMKLYPPTIGGRALVVNFGRQPTSSGGIDDYPYPIPGQPLHVPAPVMSPSTQPLTAPLPPHIPGTSPMPMPAQYPYPSSHTMISHPSLPGYGIPTESYLGDTLSVPSDLNMIRSTSPQLTHAYPTQSTHTEPMAYQHPTITVDDYSYDSGTTPLTLHGVFREPPSPTAPLTAATANTIPLQFIPASAPTYSYSLAPPTISTQPLRGYVQDGYNYPSPTHIGQSLGLSTGGIGVPATTSTLVTDTSEIRQIPSDATPTPTSEVPSPFTPSPTVSGTGSVGGSGGSGVSVSIGGTMTRVAPPPPGPRPGVAITRSSSGSAVGSPLSPLSSNGSSVINPLVSGLPTESSLLSSLAALTIGSTGTTSSTPSSSLSTVSSTSSSLYQDSPASSL